MKRRYWSVAAFVIACVAGCGGGGGGDSGIPTPVTPPGQLNGSISGTVTDTGRAPIQGVQLALSGPSASSTVSGPSGAYQFGNLGAGAYVVTPSSPGATFAPQSVAIAVSGQPAGANFMRSTLILPSTALISSYAATLHAQTMTTFGTNEQALGNSLNAQGLFHSGVHYSKSGADYVAQVQAFTLGVLAFVQLKAQTMPIDRPAAVSMLREYSTQDSDYVATYYGGVTWGLSGSSLAPFVADTKNSVADVYVDAVLSLP